MKRWRVVYGFWIAGAVLIVAAGVMLTLALMPNSYLPFWMGVAGIISLAVGGSVRRWYRDRG